MRKKGSGFIGGKLNLKIKKKKKNAKQEARHGEASHVDSVAKSGEAVQVKSDPSEHDGKKDGSEKIIKGTGRITTEKNTVRGVRTDFMAEIKEGYDIILENPSTFRNERRTVTSVLSNKTLLVHEEFTTDISTTCAFYIASGGKSGGKPVGQPADTPEAHIGVEYAKVFEQTSRQDQVEVREKTGLWSYRVVKKKVDGRLTNEEKLDMRVRSGRDKFCW
ncbi:conserved Plasmodium protein, unknown function [Plasmodium vivax]|uniref:Uncharacterized protein n=4 Tax=Plasmodium vivax TaxID=5855 RepID=A5K5N7_PLAVS|nr:hypothetical protein, conserved [Plasmodium vivax]KMZ88092.1 hypothetical protein PVBG_02553 [Plasmodium vivax Brazil I]KNA01187.1 hypothetical protein PVNG_05933 [Plasmodium vivax North Korean]EDL45222.1 hypothetical protein, conserved [Plasmodium vivax]CAG9479756.1 unnamed protein product [Plasmodium vivax]CAI7718812.1 conserved protein, unknown function [Plasmodium vivax]|eukprot:XP_001614949.1 hypothetical protein [Plasmodium vivax Sal-1]